MISYVRIKQTGTEGDVQRAALFFWYCSLHSHLSHSLSSSAIFIHGMHMLMCSDFTNTMTEEALRETETIAGKNSG